MVEQAMTASRMAVCLRPELRTVGVAGHLSLLSLKHYALLHCLSHLSITVGLCLCNAVRRHQWAAQAILVSVLAPRPSAASALSCLLWALQGGQP